MNILKEENLADKGFYLRAYRALGFEKAWTAVQNKAPTYRFFDLDYREDRLHLTPVESLPFLHSVTEVGALLPLTGRALLPAFLKPQTFSLVRKKDILCHIHLDWLLALLALKHEAGISPAQQRGLAEYLRQEVPGDNFGDKLLRVTQPGLPRSNMYTFNKNSILVDLETPEGCRNLDQLLPGHEQLIRGSEILRHMEVPEGSEPDKLLEFLTEFSRASQLIVRKFPQARAHKVAVKLRKIRRTKKAGLYIVATRTALVDPRHTDSFWHELGHWTHSWAQPEMTIRADCETYAEGFRELVEG